MNIEFKTLVDNFNSLGVRKLKSTEKKKRKELASNIKKILTESTLFDRYSYLSYILNNSETSRNGKYVKQLQKVMSNFSPDIEYLYENNFDVFDSEIDVNEKIQDILESCRFSGSINKYLASKKIVDFINTLSKK